MPPASPSAPAEESPPAVIPLCGWDGRTPSAPPAAPTPLLGRERELAAIRKLICPAGRRATSRPTTPHPGDDRHPASGHRLVTLTGPGGVGTTRLALQVAREVADGAVVVPLDAVRDRRLRGSRATTGRRSDRASALVAATMDGERFDAITKGFVRTTTRRAGLRALAGSALGAVVALRDAGNACCLFEPTDGLGRCSLPCPTS